MPAARLAPVTRGLSGLLSGRSLKAGDAMWTRRRSRLLFIAPLVALLAVASYVAVFTARVDSLIRDLSNPTISVRAAAARKLAAMQSRRVTMRLMELVARANSADDPSFQGAYLALLKTGPAAVEPLLKEPYRRGIDLPNWVPFHVSRDPYLKPWDCEGVLWRMGPVAGPPLVRLLGDDDWQVRKDAASMLGELAYEPAMDALADVAHSDPEGEVRSSAIDALGTIGGSGALEPLVSLLKDESRDVRATAADALGTLADARGVEPLLGALKDKDSLVRATAARSLGVIKDQRAVLPLIAALKDDANNVIAASAWALGQIGDPRAVMPLAVVLDECGNANARWAAASALGLTKDPRALDPLLSVTNHGYLADRSSAAYALGVLGDPHAVDSLVVLLSDADNNVRGAAADSLGRIGDKRAVSPLARAFANEKDDQVRPALAEALGLLGDTSFLMELLRHPDPSAKSEVIRAIGRVREPAAVKPLIAILSSRDESLTEDAAIALEAIGTEEACKAVEAFVHADISEVARNYKNHIRAGAPRTRLLLILALERHGTLEMAEDLLRCERPRYTSSGHLAWAVRDWADRHGVLDELESSKNSPDRPKWGRAGDL